MYYDPMICKLTTFGKTRKEAIDTAVKALDHYVIRYQFAASCYLCFRS